MAKTSVQLQGVSEALNNAAGSLVVLPKIDCPFTTVVKRAQVTDLSNDLLPKMGVERIMVQSIEEVQGETGPNGQRVFKPINDVHDQIRFVGVWAPFVSNYGAGINSGTSSSNDFIEITFYGTGINFLNTSDSGPTISISVDGGGATSVSPTTNNQLAARNYGANVIQSFPGFQNLTLGTHTAKITGTGAGNAITIHGFEIITTSGTSPNVLQVLPGTSYLGGKKLYKSAKTIDSYNTNFESGTLGTKGGHVVVYQKADGTIGKAVTPTDVTTGTVTAGTVTHTNESVIRTYQPREFGASRGTSVTGDDFSVMDNVTTRNAAFSLDDNTTNLMTTSANITETANVGAAVYGTNITFTFVGTGLDTIVSSAGGTPTFTVSVDGGTASTAIGQGVNGFVAPGILKLASGLSYGTHTVRLAVSTGNPAFSKFIVYGPNKPTIPSGAIEIADYYVFGNYVANTTAGQTTIGSGVLRKGPVREFAYLNSTSTWGLGISATSYPTGWQAFSTAAAGATLKYTFWGTGFELRGQGNTGWTANTSVSLSTNGGNTFSAATVGNFPTLVSSAYGGWSFSAGTLSQAVSNTDGSGFSISGLPLGLYTVAFAVNDSKILVVEALDVITPIHSPKSDIPGDLQDTLTIGSCTIGDSRKFSTQTVKTLANWAQAIGVVTGSNTSTAFVPVPDMKCDIKTSGNPIDISYAIEYSNNVAGSTTTFQIFVDGVPMGPPTASDVPTTTYLATQTQRQIVPVSAGVHTVMVYGKVSGNSTSYGQINRILTVKEL